MINREASQDDAVLFSPVILAFPGGGDQYTDCFYAELSRQGAIVRPAQDSGRWLLRNVAGADFAHFHWPSFHYGALTARRTIYRGLRFAAVLLLLRARGVRIIWTAHNLYPHARSSPPWVDYALRVLVCRLSALVLVHGREAGRLVMREFGVPSSRVVVIDHGHFMDYYLRDASKSEARRRLGWPEGAFVYLFIGHCKRYKNVHKLIETFQAHCQEPDSYLAIVGSCRDAKYRAEIEAIIRRRPDRIFFEPTFVPDAEVQYFLRGADAVVLPFEDVLTSGSAILALSFGRPVVAPRLGCLMEVVREDCGVLYEAGNAHGLEHGMQAVWSRAFDESAIESRALALRWDNSAATVLRSLRSILAGSGSKGSG